MNVALWILQGVARGRIPDLRDVEARWASSRADQEDGLGNDFSDGSVKLIGVAEVLGRLGLVVPWLLGIGRVLTPLAALGLTALMIGAVDTHLKRKDGHLAPTMVLGLLSAIVAWGRF
jgi:DoxX-like family